MIVSASYKTDIPAFYGEWFVNRMRAGFCLMRNPLNRKVIRVPLGPEQLNGIVFWTKNFRPFMKHLPALEPYRVPFVVQYTINGYPRSLENHVVDWRRSVETATELSSRFGQRCVVWRYDTIILSDETPIDFHLDNFQQIATGLAGVVDEVVISFLQLYKKTERNMNEMSSQSGNRWREPSIEEKRRLAEQLSTIARGKGIRLTICSQPELVTVQEPSRCIDSERLAELSGKAFSAKTQGNRPGCECSASRDIGEYDTCPHGCVYCYAVRSSELAIRRFRKHDPNGEFLFSDEDRSGIEQSGMTQLPLF